jgi:hypothetical protein
MSLLMLSEGHLRQSLNGTKWMTRRLWDAPRLTVGKSYRAVRSDVQGSMFTPRDEAPAYIVVESIHEEPLGELTPEDADAEGGYTVEEFKDLWAEMHGEWNPDQMVYVVEYETFEDDPRDA